MSDPTTTSAVLTGDDLPECDCADHVPADLADDDFWVCPKCDAVWHNGDEIA